jgi:hypothetical protein
MSGRTFASVDRAQRMCGGSTTCTANAFEAWWSPLPEQLADYQFALVEEDSDEVLAEAHTGPLTWSGEVRDLPDGIDDALQRVLSTRRARTSADTLCAFAAEVSPHVPQRGLATHLLRGMGQLASRHQLRRLIAPVRPSWKERYPLTPVERYITWRRDDGQRATRGWDSTNGSGGASRPRSPARCASRGPSAGGKPGPASSSRTRARTPSRTVRLLLASIEPRTSASSGSRAYG